MAFLGFVCKYDGADTLKDRDWVKVSGQLKKEFRKDYKGEGPVIYAQKVEPTQRPANEVIGFN